MAIEIDDDPNKLLSKMSISTSNFGNVPFYAEKIRSTLSTKFTKRQTAKIKKKWENANRRASVSLKMESRVDRGRFSRSGMSSS